MTQEQLRMQMLAGIITEGQYKAKLNEGDEEETELYSYDGHALTFALVNSIKELNKKIEKLETRIQTLENKQL